MFYYVIDCDVIRRPIFMILELMERGDPTLYSRPILWYQTTILGRVNLKSQPPPSEDVLKKKGKKRKKTRVKENRPFSEGGTAPLTKNVY